MTAPRRPVALTVAGSDSSGGAGIAADLKTFAALGVWGTAAITAVTAQNSTGVSLVVPVSPDAVRAQIVAVLDDLPVAALKTGMLGAAGVVASVADVLAAAGVTVPLVIDPVLAASTGQPLADAGLAGALVETLVPRAAVVTPNLHEAAALTGIDVRGRADMIAAGMALVARGAAAALVTGGHLEGVPADCLVVAGRREAVWIDGDRVDTAATHGTGCVLSAAITAGLAAGVDVETACRNAKAFVTGALRRGVPLGRSGGSVEPSDVSATAW